MEAFALNISLLKFFNDLAISSPYAANLVIFCAVYLGWLMVISLVFFVYRGRSFWKNFRIALFALSAGFLALFISDLIKSSFPIGRPYLLKGIKALFQPGDQAAFPSSHAAFFGGLAIYFFFRNRPWGKWFLFFALLIGIARIAAGVHYPLDVAVGWLFGFICAVAFSWIGKRVNY